jgi:hypothetical protein
MTRYAQDVTPKPNGKIQFLMKAYMEESDSGNTEHDPKNSNRRPSDQLHLRRSLDQYFYHALKSTEKRDKNQLVSRMFEDGKLTRNVLIVVDQLWLWVLNGSKISLLGLA